MTGWHFKTCMDLTFGGEQTRIADNELRFGHDTYCK